MMISVSLDIAAAVASCSSTRTTRFISNDETKQAGKEMI